LTLQKRWGIVIAIAGFLFIAYETLLPGDEVAAQNPQWCLVCGYVGGVSFLLNVILFIPLGFGIRLAGTARSRTIATGFLTSLAIELLQFRIIPGRESGVSDLLSNSLGCLVGSALADVWRTWLVPEPPTARMLARAGGLAWLGVISATAWALQPSSPAAPLRAYWSPELMNFVPFHGHLLSASLSGVNAGDGEVPHSDSLRREQLAGRSMLRLAMIADRKTNGMAPVFGVWDEYWVGQPTMGVLLSQEGTSLTLWLRMRSSDLRLRNVILRLNDVLTPSPSSAVASGHDDTVYVLGGRADGHLSLSATVGTRRVSTTLPLRPTLGWNLLMPFDYPMGRNATFLTALWVAGLLMPIGFWSARGSVLHASDLPRPPGWRARPGLLAVLTLVIMMLVGLLFIPLVFRLPIAPASDWLAAIAGVLIGWIAACWSADKIIRPAVSVAA